MLMLSVVYRHENSKSFKVKGVKRLVKESLIYGERGLSFVLTTKKGDQFHRIYVKEIMKDYFELKEKVNEKETTSQIKMAELKNMLEFNNDLKFVKEYIENKRGSYK